jgi:hypothetical protein
MTGRGCGGRPDGTTIRFTYVLHEGWKGSTRLPLKALWIPPVHLLGLLKADLLGRTTMKHCFKGIVAGLAIMLVAAGAHAVPVLQIYIEGATYDTNTETWTTSDTEFDLWVIGDVDAHGAILDVKLVASFFGVSGSMTLTPTTTAAIVDPSTPGAAAVFATGTGSHTVLPDHGIFNDPTMAGWTDYSLGGMSLTDSPVADFNGSEVFPTTFPDNGQVNVYHVVMEGWTKVHFDAYGETVDSSSGKKSFWKSPFSHDGTVPVDEKTWSGNTEMFND